MTFIEIVSLFHRQSIQMLKTYIVYWLMLTICFKSSTNVLVESMPAFKSDGSFFRRKLCLLSEGLNDIGVSNPFPVSKRLECSRVCLGDPDCHGFTVMKPDNINDFKSYYSNSDFNAVPGKLKCFIFKELFISSNCTNELEEKDYEYFEKYGICYNGGVWNENTGRCDCVKPEKANHRVFGKFCNSPVRSCAELHDAGFTYSGWRTITPIPDQPSISVYCLIADKKKVIRTQVAVNSLRTATLCNFTFSDYENGFATRVNKNYWIGLKYIRAILLSTPRPGNLVMGYLQQDKPITTSHSGVTNAKISSAKHGYRLHFDDHFGDGPMESEDRYCFREAFGMQFSSYDEDNDANGIVNCAANSGSGWWFRDCYPPCNMLGLRQNSGLETDPEYVRLTDIPSNKFKSFIVGIKLFVDHSFTE